jgi:Ca2+-binding RTX toxin-like protein
VLTDSADRVSYKGYDHAVIVAANDGNDRIRGSQFDDTLNGGAGSDRLRGGGGDDALSGDAGRDHLRGGAGGDTLNGGTGRDTLTGGTGHDTFVFDTAPGSKNLDEITDFRSADDTFLLDSSVFSGLAMGSLESGAFVIGKAATDAGDRIIYNKGSGFLLFDVDGPGGAAAFKFAHVGCGTSISADDFMVV